MALETEELLVDAIEFMGNLGWPIDNGHLSLLFLHLFKKWTLRVLSKKICRG